MTNKDATANEVRWALNDLLRTLGKLNHDTKVVAILDDIPKLRLQLKRVRDLVCAILED